MTSYSFHIGNKKSAITTKGKLMSVAKHNLRLYKAQEDENGKKFDKTKIVTLVGSSNLYKDVLCVYKKTFDKAVEKYNENKIDCRKIKNYFEHISNNKRNDLAVEIIIQIGDKEYWQNKSWNKKMKMNDIFTKQIEKLKELVPNFAIANATVHYDEASPHLHIVGVPVANFEKGLEKRVSKSKVFTREKLEELQVEMRKDLPFKLKEKEKGRNRDLSVAEYKALMEYFKREPTKMKFIEKTYIPFNKVLVDRSELSNVLEENKELKEKVSEQADLIDKMKKEDESYATVIIELEKQKLEKQKNLLDEKEKKLNEIEKNIADFVLEERELILESDIDVEKSDIQVNYECFREEKEEEQKYKYKYNEEIEPTSFDKAKEKVLENYSKQNKQKQNKKTKKVNRNHDDMELY